ncbi:hypothetical protein ScoT_37640 [Streptomyces albidoflavus]|uniref:Uncharacterized protein n=1 Tax=Streptomyces albidoflavus TaxID=1886 RepID=A0AA37BZC4_9ACTN|nr:hypothetical protein ScoT_37640 [Streptomyces albidoflavus]
MADAPLLPAGLDSPVRDGLNRRPGLEMAGLVPSLPTPTVAVTYGLKRRPGWGLVWLGSAPPCPP